MIERVRTRIREAYIRHLERSLSDPPTHVAIIQDGNRRYARQQGTDHVSGHRQGARTTAQVLEWCNDYGIEELTLYAFSTENFDRPPEERAAIFDLLEQKLVEFADADPVHENGVSIRAIGDIDRLPNRVTEAIGYAEWRTAHHDEYRLNVALAYGGRTQLLSAARGTLEAVADGTIDPDGIGIGTIEDRLYDRPVRDVDLILRTGGDCRTSNFLPWHANGNEAAAVFTTPYWPEFDRIDFLRALRTYEHREASWRRHRAWRAADLLRELGEGELGEARSVLQRYRDLLPEGALPVLDGDVDPDLDGTPAATDGGVPEDRERIPGDD